MATSTAVRPAPTPPPAPAPAPAKPADPLVAYYRGVRQMNLQLAKDRYKNGFKVRTQEYIRGRGTLAIVNEEICMGCTHCFDNCAFEAIDMVDRKFALPDYSYTSRKAIIIDDNCVGCEKCAIVCPVDAITMVTKFGFEVKDGRVVSTTAPPPLPRPAPSAAPGKPAAPTPAAPTPAPAPAPAPAPEEPDEEPEAV
jgi:ferredoxin